MNDIAVVGWRRVWNTVGNEFNAIDAIDRCRLKRLYRWAFLILHLVYVGISILRPESYPFASFTVDITWCMAGVETRLSFESYMLCSFTAALCCNSTVRARAHHMVVARRVYVSGSTRRSFLVSQGRSAETVLRFRFPTGTLVHTGCRLRRSCLRRCRHSSWRPQGFRPWSFRGNIYVWWASAILSSDHVDNVNKDTCSLMMKQQDRSSTNKRKKQIIMKLWNHNFLLSKIRFFDLKDGIPNNTIN